MLERIILTSSEPGDTVMDCYAGSGATLVQAARLGRMFIGMDNSPAARSAVENELGKAAIRFQSIVELQTGASLVAGD